MEYNNILYETESFEERLEKALFHRELQKEGYLIAKGGPKGGFVLPNYQASERIRDRVRERGGLLDKVMHAVKDICDGEEASGSCDKECTCIICQQIKRVADGWRPRETS